MRRERSLLLLVCLGIGCHAGAGRLHDEALEAELRASAAPPPQPSSAPPALPIREQPTAEAMAAPLRFNDEARAAGDRSPVVEVDPAGDERDAQIADLASRLEALEHKLATSQQAARAKHTPSEPAPSLAALVAGTLPVVLALITLIAVAAALAAIARAHRTRGEVARLRAASKVLSTRVNAQGDDAIDARLRSILELEPGA
ncbi:MAG TPA: hypothetical protein VFX59_13095 [Polyangiales bacterium]|nr:hypothetical protein [Polyangiales bacterium]